MAENTSIGWCDHTFNCWRGCTKVSPGCQSCYAEKLSARNPAVLGEWGPDGKRVIAAESYWKLPLKWNRAAKAAGVRKRVFCASLADVFENRADLIEPRQRLFRLIEDTPNLDWLLLTKRPQFMAECLNQTCLYGDGWLTHPRPNVWLGVSVEDQQRADERIPLLLQIPAAVRFLSVEPLLGSVKLERYLVKGWCPACNSACFVAHAARRLLSLVIVGGESGHSARPCHVEHVRDIVRQCREAEVACFTKQLGSHAIDTNIGWPENTHMPNIGGRISFRDPKGSDPAEWPEDLRVQEWPDCLR